MEVPKIKSYTTPQAHDSKTLESQRSKLAQAHTRTVNSHVYDVVTGEYYGVYTTSTYSPEPIYYTIGTPARLGENWLIEDDCSVSPLETSDTHSHPTELTPVIELCHHEQTSEVRTSSTRGPKPQLIDNPLAPALCILKFEERPTPWLDDIVFGAIYTGPGVIAGKHSASLPDVMSVLRLSVISIAAAANCLLNHELRPMSTRQLQRVIEAARTALRGIALYLERHPQILQSIDLQVDFDTFWSPPQAAPTKVPSNEHPMKQQALMMIKAEVPVKTIARALGISKNTAKQWKQAATRANYREGSVEGN